MQGVDRQYFFHTRHGKRFAVVKALQLAAQHGVHAHTGKQQTIGANVSNEQGRAVAFGLGVQARQALSNQFEIHSRLERDGRRQANFGRCCRQFAKRGFFARAVRDHAVFHVALAGGYLPLLGGRTHEHRSSAGTGFAHGQPQVFDAG